MRFKEYLTEKFGNGYPTVKRPTGMGDKEHLYTFSDDKGNEFEALFTVYPTLKLISVIFDNDGEMSVTGTSGTSAIKVFATIAKLLKDLVGKHPGFTIEFSGESTRDRLYERLAKTIASKTGGQFSRSSTFGGVKYTIAFEQD
jgi:hypothetical protein